MVVKRMTKDVIGVTNLTILRHYTKLLTTLIKEWPEGKFTTESQNAYKKGIT